MHFARSTQSGAQLHGFCDVSKRAYAACIYSRTVSADGCTEVNLLVAKTKVEPVKAQIIPRLELLGAVLLTRLLIKVQSDLSLNDVSAYAWTDSEVVLAWLQGHSSRWPLFVAHRVAEVQEVLPCSQWKYVSSSQNPADQATRSALHKELQTSQLWWNGPSWLTREAADWPTSKASTNEIQSVVSVQHPAMSSTNN